jgi:uncharacterized membrane protein
MVSLAMFVLYVNHTARGLRVVSVIGKIGDETRRTINREMPLVPPPAPTATTIEGGTHMITSARGGVLCSIDIARLCHLARRRGVVIEVIPEVGDFVPSGAPLFRIRGDGDPPSQGLASTAEFGLERTMVQDLRFGFRQLVDIAERALSPAVNDPTTAVQAIDQLHDVLRILATRPWPTGEYADDEGHLRVVLPIPSWDELLHLAVDEIRTVGASSLQVDVRLRTMLKDLLTVASGERRASVETELALLEAGVRRGLADASDRERVLSDERPTR